MKPKILIVLATAAALIAGAAPSAGAATCSDDPAGALASAVVSYVGDSWGPTPLWRVSVPALNLSIDIAANSAAEALAAISIPLCNPAPPVEPVGDPVEPIDPAAPAAPAPDPAPATDYTAQAAAIADAATVTLIGPGFGSQPLWRVSIPSMNLSIDVNAVDQPAARAAVVPSIAVLLGQGRTSGAASTPSAPSASTPAAPTTSDTPAPAAPTSSKLASAAVTVSSKTVKVTTSDIGGPVKPTARNPLLTAILSSALDQQVTITKGTACYLGPRPVDCASLYRTIPGKTAKVVLVGDKIKSVTVYKP